MFMDEQWRSLWAGHRYIKSLTNDQWDILISQSPLQIRRRYMQTYSEDGFGTEREGALTN